LKIYLASRYSRISELNDYKTDLEALGHTVTSRWLGGDHHLSEVYAPKKARRFAVDDISDIDAADCLIQFPDEAREPSTSRGGQHTEFGYALGTGKRIIIVGFRQHVFHYLPGIEFYETWKRCLRTAPALRDREIVA